MRKQSTRILLICLVLSTVVQIAPSGQSQESTEFLQLANLYGVRGGNLVVSISSDPSNFNRMFTPVLSGAMVTERISADLVHINRADFKLEASLAVRWESDKSGKVYTIHLRHGIRFSNNTPFTADDVLFTWQVLTDPNVQSAMAGQVETNGTFPTMSKVDAYTVRLAFQQPVGMGLRMLDSIPILPKSVLQKPYQEGRLDKVWGPAVNPSEVAGLGPFRLKEYQRGTRVVLERNPYYWKKDRAGQLLPYLDTITYLIIPDLNSEALQFRQGELDLVNSLNPENYAMLRRTPSGYTLKDLGAGLAMDFVWFNLNQGRKREGKPPVDSEKLAVFEKTEFRQAISFALDRKGMVSAILLGLGTPQYGPVSSGNPVWYHNGIVRTEYNPSHARELLAKAGLKDTNGDGIVEYGTRHQPLEITMLTSRGSSVREKTAEVVRDNLLKVGIRVGIQNLLPNEMVSRFLESFDYEAVLFGFTPTDVAPDLQTDLWYSSGKTHFWCPDQEKPLRPWEAAMDSLVSTLVKNLDPQVRKATFDQVQSIWATEMPAIPTIAPNILAGWNNKLTNVRPSIMRPHLIWNVEEISKRK
jgi:peptide/nickel transport system substrate-binding protein